MDDFIKLLKFGLKNRVAILSVWVMIFGVAGAGGYFSMPEKPVEHHVINLPLPEPKPEIIATPPSTIVDRVIIKEACTCEDGLRKHEKIHHFID